MNKEIKKYNNECCKSITPQSQKCYDQMICLDVPDDLDIRYNSPDRERKEVVCVDPCIASEVWELWQLGIITEGACCGHKQKRYTPHIAVRNDFIPVMKKLGYKVQFNPCRPNDEDLFKPLSIIYD